jgi:hypothetical protein
VLDVCERLNLRVDPNGSSHLSPLGDGAKPRKK